MPSGVYTYASKGQTSGEMSTMNSAVRKWRDHRRSMRNMREFERALNRAPSTSMRDELLAAAQRQNFYLR